MALSNILADFFTEVYGYLQLEKVDPDIFSSAKSIFLIRSADMKTLRQFVSMVREVNPEVYFYVLSHAVDQEDIYNICGEKVEIISYEAGGSYSLSKLAKEIECIKAKQFDFHVILYNNCYGMGFDNIEEIMTAITTKPYYAFNSYWEVLKITRPLLHLQALKLLGSLSDWYWEIVGDSSHIK